MHFLVIGCGSIGQRHIRNLKRLGHEVSGCEKNRLTAKHAGKIHDIEVFGSLKEALSRKYDGVFICTPTSLHVPIALEAAKRGMHLFIEKPLSNSLQNVNELSGIAKKKRLVVFVACNTRFLPSFKFAKKMVDSGKIGKVLSVKAECGFYLPYWHPYEDYRKGYSANVRLGGGVIFDDIHEIDLLCWLFGGVKDVFCFADKVSGLQINAEDLAEIFLEFESGLIAQMHLDYLQRTYRRYYEFIGEKGVIIWDYITHEVRWYGGKAKRWKNKVFTKELNTRNEVMFIDEVRHFINCVKGKGRSANDIKSASYSLKVALACHESAHRKGVVSL